MQGWKTRTGKLGTIIQGVENARPLAMEHRTDKCSETKIQFISNDLTKSNVSEQKDTQCVL